MCMLREKGYGWENDIPLISEPHSKAFPVNTTLFLSQFGLYPDPVE